MIIFARNYRKKTSSSQTESSNFLLEKSQVQCQLAFVSNRRQLKKQLLEVASQISDDEDDTVMKSSSPNYRTHPEAFQDSQDPNDMWQKRQKTKWQNAERSRKIFWQNIICTQILTERKLLFTSMPGQIPRQTPVHE